MSTKIYEARCFPLARLNDFIDFIRAKTFAKILWRARLLIRAVNPEAELVKAWRGIESSGEMTRTQRWYFVKAQAKESSLKSERDPFFCLDASWALWVSDGHVYAIPYGEEWTRRGIVYPKWAKDFCYFNNTDRPRGVSERDWDFRAKRWDLVNCGEGTSSHRARLLVYEIVDFKSFGGIVDLDLAVLPFHKRRNRSGRRGMIKR